MESQALHREESRNPERVAARGGSDLGLSGEAGRFLDRLEGMLALTMLAANHEGEGLPPDAIPEQIGAILDMVEEERVTFTAWEECKRQMQTFIS